MSGRAYEGATQDYRGYLLTRLKDPSEAAAYLNAVLEEGEEADVLLALRDISDARE